MLEPAIAAVDKKPPPPRSLDSLLWGLPVLLAWTASCWVARRSHGYFVPRDLVYLMCGGALIVLVVALWQVRRNSRWRWRLALLAVALPIPVIAVRAVPGMMPLPTTPIPGRPTLVSSASPDGHSNIFVMHGDQDHITKLTDVGGFETPRLSPDGRRILFARGGNVHVMDLSADDTLGPSTQLTFDRAELGAAPWSPDGKQIAFTHDLGIRILDLDAGTTRRVTEPGVRAWAPAWSPDGTRLAYGFDRDIWTIRLDGGDPQRITRGAWGACGAYAPIWSPDAKRIAYSCSRGGKVDVYVAKADGSEVRNLTAGSPDFDSADGWTPDGQHVLFLSDRSHTGGVFLYFMDLDGGNVELTSVPFRDGRAARLCRGRGSPGGARPRPARPS
jgi:dipeptidyl aminopeptidase/acylaminoacyl peptidase